MPKKTGNDSVRNGNSDSSNSTESGTSDSRPFREIIYLDLNRITSYLSQIQGGLTEYLERIRTQGVETTPDSTDFTIGGGPIPAAAAFRGRQETDIDTTSLIQRKRHHHAALNVLEDILVKRDLLGPYDEAKPFIRHEGRPLLVDYRLLRARLLRMADVQESLEVISRLKFDDQETEAPPLSNNQAKKLRAALQQERDKTEKKKKRLQETYEHFARVLDLYEDRLDIYFPNQEDDPLEELALTGVIHRDNLVIPSEWFQAAYGSPTRIQVTMLALDTQHTGESGEDGKISIALPTEGGGMGYAFAYLMNEFNNLVGEQYTIATAHSVVPIAVYIDL